MRIGSRRAGQVALLGLALGVAACTAEAAGRVEPTRGDLIARKLGRGIANVVTCPLELARMPSLVTRQSGYIAGLTAGTAQGVWHTIRRGGAGLFEILTFPFEIPEDYEPIIKPEFVFSHGQWGPAE